MTKMMAKAITTLEKATLDFLSIILLNSSDEIYFYSTLIFVIKEAMRLKKPIRCVFFNQLL